MILPVFTQNTDLCIFQCIFQCSKSLVVGLLPLYGNRYGCNPKPALQQTIETVFDEVSLTAVEKPSARVLSNSSPLSRLPCYSMHPTEILLRCLIDIPECLSMTDSTYKIIKLPNLQHSPRLRSVDISSPRLEVRLAELDALVSDPKLYDDSVRAGKIVKERAKVESKLEAVKSLTLELQTWREMHGKMTRKLAMSRLAFLNVVKSPNELPDCRYSVPATYTVCFSQSAFRSVGSTAVLSLLKHISVLLAICPHRAGPFFCCRVLIKRLRRTLTEPKFIKNLVYFFVCLRYQSHTRRRSG